MVEGLASGQDWLDGTEPGMVLEVDRIVTGRRLHLGFHPLGDASPPAALPR